MHNSDTKLGLVHTLCATFVLLIIAGTPFAFEASALSKIETAFLNQDYAAVEQLATQALKESAVLRDDLPLLNYYLGVSLVQMESYEAARIAFEESMKLSETDQLRDKAVLGIFDTYYLGGDYDKALQTVERLLKISPRSELLSLVYLKAARAQLKLAHWDDAHRHLKRIVKQFPDSIENHTARQLLEEKRFFSVQVGAFLDPERAKALAEDLLSRGEYAYIVETKDKQGRNFYRVRVGRHAQLDAARDLKTKLAGLGYPTEIYP